MKKNFGKYQVVKELGKGAMGIVYLAFDPVLERQVAIKTISAAESDLDLKERFIREARSAGKLKHNNIITIYDFGEEEGQLFIAMEYLEGQDLDAIIASKPNMPLQEKLEIVKQICLGLDYAHRNDIFHRDIKPGNIKVLQDGTIKIMDFGLATMQTSGLTKTGTIMGTPHYMSPEMVSGKKVDGRSDQFAVGVILYEFLSYTKPFSGDNISTILYKILNEEPKTFDPGVTSKFPEVRLIAEKALKKDMNHRYTTMKDMANAITKLQQKIQTQGFEMSEPTVVVDDEMETLMMDTEMDFTKKPAEDKKKSKLLPLMAGIAGIGIIVAAYFLFFTAPATVVQEQNGYLVFDVKPYAVIEEITNTESKQSILLNEQTKIAPSQIALAPGKYSISFSHPSWQGEKKSQEFIIESGTTKTINEAIDPNFATDSIKHFYLNK